MRMTTMIIGLLIAGINLPVSAQEVTQEAPAATQQKIALPYPMPEFYLIQKDGVNTYIKNAFGFIDKNPNSPFVHRVAMDLYIVGTYFKNQNLINTSRSFLLNSGANQLYGSFLIST